MKGAALAAALCLVAIPAAAQLTQRDLAAAVTRPPADARLPAALRFRDPAGHAVTLGQVAADRPTVLLFADFTCRHLCGPGLMLTAGALHDSGLVPGRDYRLAIVGLDPKDDAAAARRFAAPLRDLPAVAAATTVLRGDPATVAAATAALGYGHVYDAANDQFAHDASVYVFAADGRLAALLPEMALRPALLRRAVAGGAPESLVSRITHLCYGLSALTGRYDRPVVVALQLAAAIALLGGGAALLLRRHGQARA